jgi:small ligand-binding sensory domain FIST
MAIGQQPTWEEAIAEATARMPIVPNGETIDLAFLFASSAYAGQFHELVASARRATRPRLLIGCSSQGIIGTRREVEGQPALTLLTFSLPGVVLRPVRLAQGTLEKCSGPEAWQGMTRVPPDDDTAWLLFADPFTLDAEGLLAAWSEAYPGTPVVGGMASGDVRLRRTDVFLNDEVYEHGAVAMALGGAYGVRTIVSQGCTRIGKTWTITGAAGLRFGVWLPTYALGRAWECASA